MVAVAIGEGARIAAQVRFSLLAEDHDLELPHAAPAPAAPR
jgi:hypothetical protein